MLSVRDRLSKGVSDWIFIKHITNIEQSLKDVIKNKIVRMSQQLLRMLEKFEMLKQMEL